MSFIRYFILQKIVIVLLALSYASPSYAMISTIFNRSRQCLIGSYNECCYDRHGLSLDYDNLHGVSELSRVYPTGNDATSLFWALSPQSSSSFLYYPCGRCSFFNCIYYVTCRCCGLGCCVACCAKDALK